MNSLQLSPKQLQEICHDFTNKPNGINTLLSIMLNSLMKAERKDFLVSNHCHGNKAVRSKALLKTSMVKSFPKARYHASPKACMRT